ncbi:MAG TPA: hypothetical protein VD859_08605, partial [Nocardioides sp.]|nr:hypothetical protein [Nocardioides sp.]
MTAAANRRRAILALLVLVVVACLGTAAWIFVDRSAGDSISDRVWSLREDEVPTTGEDAEREQLLSLSREFAIRFNTYNPEMLDEEGHLPDYAAVSDLMSAKFGDVFTRNVGYAEETVAQLGVARSAEVFAVGVAAQDEDSADVLVAGIVELSYPVPDQEGGQQGGDEEGEEPRVSSGPQRFRYQVSLVKVDGTWLVDD